MTDLTDVQRSGVRNTAHIILANPHDHSAQSCELAAFILATVEAPAPTLAEEMREWGRTRLDEEPSYEDLVDLCQDVEHFASRAEQLEQENQEQREWNLAVNEQAGVLARERDEARAEAKTWREQDENDCEMYAEELANVREALAVEGRRVEKIAAERDEAKKERDYLATEIDKANTDILHLTAERDEARAEVDRLTEEAGGPSGDDWLAGLKEAARYAINATNPAASDVQPGEAWIVETRLYGRGVAVRIADGGIADRGYPWAFSGHGTQGHFLDSSITLVSRLVPAPRVITDPDELDALPFRSVILSADDKNPDVYQRDSYDEWLDITAQGYSSSQVIRMERSVNVLYQPKEDQK